MDEYTRDALVAVCRAARSRADYIVINRRDDERWRSAEVAVVHGLLTPGKLHEFDEQSSEMRYRITDVARKLSRTERNCIYTDRLPTDARYLSDGPMLLEARKGGE